MIFAGLIGIVLFNNLLKQNNNIILAFIITLFGMYASKGLFAARHQIISYLLFGLEVGFLHQLFDNGKKRYFFFLIILSILAVNFHDTLYPVYFIMMMPYLGELIISKIKFLNKSEKFITKEIKNSKLLVLLIFICIITGLFTPLFGTAYTNMVVCMSGVSADFIGELQQVNIINNIPILFIVFLTIAIISFTKTKIRIKDLLFVFGYALFALTAERAVFFLFLYGIVSFANMITAFFDEYLGKDSIDKIIEKLIKSKIEIIVLLLVIFIFSVKSFISMQHSNYVDDMKYPIDATEWILKNIDYKEARIWTQFDFGSYLELHEIPVYLDSRSEVYCEEQNPGCTVLEDWLNVVNGNINYNEIFNKYQITHVLVTNMELINLYIFDDEDYKLIYQDDNFSLYERR